MYRELQPFREALSQALKTTLFPAAAGVDPDKLLETYLDRLTTYLVVLKDLFSCACHCANFLTDEHLHGGIPSRANLFGPNIKSACKLA